MPSSSQTIDGAKMTLVDLADISYSEYLSSTEEEADQQFEQERKTFLAAAREAARNRFGSSADQLQWTYTPHASLPDDVEEATTPLSPGRPEYFRYRYNHASEVTSYELVQPCSACGESRITEVAGLVDLGRLLAAEGGARGE